MTAKPHPSYVLHDEMRWHVDGVTDIDGAAAYNLSHRTSYGKARPGSTVPYATCEIVARVSECEFIQPKPKVRRFKDCAHVLEFDSRGTMFIRRTRSPKRYATSLAAIYSMTVKAVVANEKALKRLAKYRRK